MKKSLFFTLTIACVFSSQAQNSIPNPSFENWTSKGLYKVPTDWGSVNDKSGGFVITAIQATGTDAHSGTYGIKLESKNAGQLAPGIVATGTLTSNSSGGGGVTGGVPYSMRPDSFAGWYKYIPVGSDTAVLSVSFTKWNNATKMQEEVGTVKFTESKTITSYKRFAAKVNYTSSSTPDTMVIVLRGSGPSATLSQVGTVLYIDDIEFIMPQLNTDNGLISSTSNGLLVSASPNPASDKLNLIFSEPITNSRLELSIYDITGQLVLNKTITGNNYVADISSFNSGIYFYKVSDNVRYSTYNKFVVK